MEVKCPKHGFFSIRAASHLRGYGCPNCPKEESADIKRRADDIGKKRRPLRKSYSHIATQGQRYGRLTIVREVERKGKNRYVLCLCDCGNTKIANFTEMRKGKIQSCGCYAHDKTVARSTKHGLAKKHPLYGVWKGIKSRCSNPNSEAFFSYGGRGIKICDEWSNDFSAFYNWCILNGYKEGLSIDRIDNNGDYSPSNCRFANQYTQARNKSNNRAVNYNGKHWHSMAQFCEDYALPYSGVQNRLHNGWSIEEIVNYYIKKKC